MMVQQPTHTVSLARDFTITVTFFVKTCFEVICVLYDRKSIKDIRIQGFQKRAIFIKGFRLNYQILI